MYEIAIWITFSSMIVYLVFPIIVWVRAIFKKEHIKPQNIKKFNIMYSFYLIAFLLCAVSISIALSEPIINPIISVLLGLTFVQFMLLVIFVIKKLVVMNLKSRKMK